MLWNCAIYIHFEFLIDNLLHFISWLPHVEAVFFCQYQLYSSAVPCFQVSGVCSQRSQGISPIGLSRNPSLMLAQISRDLVMKR